MRRPPRAPAPAAGDAPRSATTGDPEQGEHAQARRAPNGSAGYPAWSVAQTTHRAIAARHATVAGAARSGAVSLAVIWLGTIITGVEDSAELIGFYERAYSHRGPEADSYARWRALSAVGKADHVVGLCRSAGVAPASTLDVGCGDGALLCELRPARFRRRPLGAGDLRAGRRDRAARPRRGGDRPVRRRPPAAAGRLLELGILSHVLEHVPDPPALLAEVARVCGVVVFEVPLEDNVVGAAPLQARARRGDRPPAAPFREAAREIASRRRAGRRGRAPGPAAARGSPLLRRGPARAGRGDGEVGACAPGTQTPRACARAARVHAPLRGAVPPAGRVTAESSSPSTSPISSSGTASGSASFWRAMPSASASIATARCSAGIVSSRSKSRAPSAIRLGEDLAHLGESGRHLRAHPGVAYPVGPELHEQQQRLRLALDHRHPLPARRPRRGRRSRRAPARRSRSPARAPRSRVPSAPGTGPPCPRSSSTARRSSKPASEAISSTEAPWKPPRANTLRAAASSRSRVFARLCSRVMRVPAGGHAMACILLDRANAISIMFIIPT